MKKIPQLSDLSDEDDGASGETPSAGDPDATGAPLSAGETAAPDVPRSVSRGEGREGAEPFADGASEPESSEADGPGAGGDRVGRSAPGARRSGASGPKGSGSGKVSRTRARRYARERALQALYQWDLASAESSDVRRQFIDRQDMSRVDVEYFERLFRGVSHDVDSVDESLGRALDRPIGDLDPIERAVLRVAAFELAEVPETPARVVINEGVEITKRFGADNGHRYVNGVLDRLAGLVRPREMRRG